MPERAGTMAPNGEYGEKTLESGEMTVVLHYAEWSRLLGFLDGTRGREAPALAAAVRRQLLDQMSAVPERTGEE